MGVSIGATESKQRFRILGSIYGGNTNYLTLNYECRVKKREIMSELKVTGSITSISDVQTGKSKAGNEWAKLVFAINTGGEYPKTVAFTVFGADKVDKFVQYNSVGDEVEVSFDPVSREHEGRFYTDLNAWKIWGLNRGNKAAEPALVAEEEDDDLPF